MPGQGRALMHLSSAATQTLVCHAACAEGGAGSGGCEKRKQCLGPKWPQFWQLGGWRVKER